MLHLVTGVRGLLRASATFTSDSPEVVYLFVRNLEINDQGVVDLPDIFWSAESSGREHLSKEEISRINLTVTVKLETDGHQYPIDVYKGVGDLYEKYGTKLDPNDIFRFLEVPPVSLKLFTQCGQG